MKVLANKDEINKDKVESHIIISLVISVLQYKSFSYFFFIKKCQNTINKLVNNCNKNIIFIFYY